LHAAASSWGEESPLDKETFAEPTSIPWAEPAVDNKQHITRTWHLQTHEGGNSDLFLLINDLVVRHISFDFEGFFDLLGLITYSVTTPDMHSPHGPL
jgi:hypothetical protein